MKLEAAEPTAQDLIEVLGALTFALAAAMPDLQRTRFANTLGRLSERAGQEGKPGVRVGLLQLAAAAQMTPP